MGIILPPSVISQPINLQVRGITLEDGLDRMGILGIVQDHQGYLWLGAYDGLARYDGYDFVHFEHNPQDPSSVPPSPTFAVFEDTLLNLWVGSCRGLALFNRATEKFQTFLLGKSDPASSWGCISSIDQDNEGMLWLGTMGAGVIRFDPVSRAFHRFLNDPDDPRSIQSNWATRPYIDKKGTVWIGTSNGFARYDARTGDFERFAYDDSLPADPFIDILEPETFSRNEIYQILHTNDGTMWIATAGSGICTVGTSGEVKECFDHAPELPDSKISRTAFALYEENDTRIWVGTKIGLYIFDRNTRTFSKVDHIAGDVTYNNADKILCLYRDNSGLLWIGTEGAYLGSFDLESDSFNFTAVPGGSLSMSHASDGSLWIAGNNGLTVLRPEAGPGHGYVISKTYTNDQLGYTVTGFLEDRRKSYWVGLLNAGQSRAVDGQLLGRFDPATGSVSPISLYSGSLPSPVSDFAIDMTENRDGSIWVGTNQDSGSGIYRYDPETQEVTIFRRGENDRTSLTSPGTFAQGLFADRGGNVWIGTWSGLNRIDFETREVKRYVHVPNDNTAIPGSSVFSVTEDPDGEIWIASDALARLNRETDTFTSYAISGRIQRRGVSCILSDEDGVLWMSTFRNIVRFDPQTGTFSEYGAENGLRMLDFAHGGSCMRSSITGEIFFTGEGGFYSFDPRTFDENAVPPHIVISGIDLQDQFLSSADGDVLTAHISETPYLNLSHQEHDITVHFTGIHFANPEAIRYWYRMDPVDEEWHYAGTMRTARFTHLRPGDYTFYVTAANPNGVKNTDPAVIRIVINPPWWQTGWAIGLFVALALSSIWGFSEWRRWRIKKYAEFLRQQVALRTEKLEAEKKKSESQSRLLSELDAVKNRFITNLSHEFRTPLTMILGPLQDSLEGRFGQVPTDLHRYHRVMHRSARRLLKLVNQLLDLSTLESGKLTLSIEAGDINALIRQIAQSYTVHAERVGVNLHVRVPGTNKMLRYDPDAIEKIVTNLLSNAIKYTPENGDVTLECDVADNELTVAVSDTGKGLSEKEIDLVFNRFERGAVSNVKLKEGWGIGLALANELAKLHGGRLEVSSTPGAGSTFSFVCPAIEAKLAYNESDVQPDPSDQSIELIDGEASIPGIAPESGNGKEIGKTVLVVDDSEDVRTYLRDHLERDYNVLEAIDGEDGFEKALANRPDLLLSDVLMPKCTGFDLCRRIRANDQIGHMPIILLTAKASPEDTVEGMECGADAYMSKPFDIEELKARVHNLIHIRERLIDRFQRNVLVRPREIPAVHQDQVFLERLIDEIEDHIGDHSFSVDWLASDMHLSRRQLERRCEDILGEHPGELIRRLRLERAAQLLRAQAGTVSEIAHAVGFRSSSHFSTAFRGVFDETPTSYSANHSQPQSVREETDT